MEHFYKRKPWLTVTESREDLRRRLSVCSSKKL